MAAMASPPSVFLGNIPLEMSAETLVGWLNEEFNVPRPAAVRMNLPPQHRGEKYAHFDYVDQADANILCALQGQVYFASGRHRGW